MQTPNLDPILKNVFSLLISHDNSYGFYKSTLCQDLPHLLYCEGLKISKIRLKYPPSSKPLQDGLLRYPHLKAIKKSLSILVNTLPQLPTFPA